MVAGDLSNNCGLRPGNVDGTGEITEKFRATLRSAGFYADWKQKYGSQAWAALEKQVGSLS